LTDQQILIARVLEAHEAENEDIIILHDNNEDPDRNVA
jgi:hypothetical protein